MLPAAGPDPRTGPVPGYPQRRPGHHHAAAATPTAIHPTLATTTTRFLPASGTTGEPGLLPASAASSVRGDEGVCAAGPAGDVRCVRAAALLGRHRPFRRPLRRPSGDK